MSRYRESPEYREIRCPCCGKPMQEREVERTYLGYDDDWCVDYHYRYRCKECNIRYDEEEHEWKLPKGYVATITPKQINFLNGLYNGYRGYDYDYYGRDINYVSFGIYTPNVLSKEFATRLIQDELDERKAWKLHCKKEEEFKALLESYGINTCHIYGSDDTKATTGYGLPITGGLIIFRVNNTTYEVNTQEIEIRVNDLPTFQQSYNNEDELNKLMNLKSDLIKLKKVHDNL